MIKHPYFNLLLHDDEELESILGTSITERSTLHQWPLSCVQRIRMSDASTIIYKVQGEFSVEAPFYRAARSSLLVSARAIEQNDSLHALLLEDIDAPCLSELTLDRDEALRLVDDITYQISQIEVEGALPFLTTIGGLSNWNRYTITQLRDLETLIERGTFRETNRDVLDRIASVCNHSSVLTVIQSTSGLVHGDLNRGNIIMHPDGTKVIDWQKAFYGPIELNRANLLEELGMDPRPYVNPGVIDLLGILKISWFIQCALRWFPDGAEGYDREIAKLQLCLTEC
ncbi:phosphotransferase [Paenibacillus sp. OV219]|uniref:phosphotransferase n=1 Tax=Paenibacillus sp. OV219 TaxID=1884377 RepID=UPI0008C14149|nr:phosphotransferase [Paenibacillus sp. OV219]SEN98706.1 Phosphotransferase enzyme family protein [Paenibacillus sp. OV219]